MGVGRHSAPYARNKISCVAPAGGFDGECSGKQKLEPMKITWKRLASFSLIVLSSYTLQADTYYLQSLGGQGSAPYPMDPYHGTMPLTEVATDIYLVDDSSVESESGRGGGMTMNSIDPNDPDSTNEISGSSLP